MSTDLHHSYSQDFSAWALHNAALLRTGQLAELDLENVAEELEGMSRSDHREIESRLEVLLMHLLKWRYQPKQRSSSWKATIAEQRNKIRKLLKDSPSLKYGLEDKFKEAYEEAVYMAVIETELDKSTFPATCPFTLEQCLDSDFWPEAATS